MNLVQILPLFSAFSVLIPLLAGRKIQGILWYYAWLCGICDLLYYSHFFPKFPYWFGNIFFIAQFSMLSAYMIQQLFSGLRQRLLYGVAGLLTIVYGLYAANLNFWRISYEGVTLSYFFLLLIILYGLISFAQKATRMETDFYPFFAVCAGLLIYISGSVLMMLFARHTMRINKPFFDVLWCVVHTAVNIIKNIAIGYAFRLTAKKRQTVR